MLKPLRICESTERKDQVNDRMILGCDLNQLQSSRYLFKWEFSVLGGERFSCRGEF